MILDAMYVCSSPFQIMTAIFLVTMNNEKADIYITQSFPKAEEYVDAVKNQNLFHEVFYFSSKVFAKYFNKSGRISAKLQAVHGYVSPEPVVKSFIAKDTFYNKIYAPNRDIIGRYVLFYHYKNKINTEFIRYEEGNSTYMGNQLQEKKYEIWLRKVLYGKKAISISTLYVYSPELFCKIRNVSGNYVKQIEISEQSTEIVKNLFHYNQVLPKPIALLLDTHKRIFNDEEKKQLEDVYAIISNNLKSELYYKPHPRDNEMEYDNTKTIPNNIPFEVICEDSSIDNAVLISYVSTSVSSPKIIFNKEPFIMLLYKLVHSRIDIDTEKMDFFYQNLIDSYDNKNRVFIPKNESELMQSIRIINENLI